MIDPDNLQPAAEPLHKVLPAGEPLVSTWWACPVCAVSQKGAPPKSCLCLPDNPRCPVMGGEKP